MSETTPEPVAPVADAPPPGPPGVPLGFTATVDVLVSGVSLGFVELAPLAGASLGFEGREVVLILLLVPGAALVFAVTVDVLVRRASPAFVEETIALVLGA